MSMYQGIETEIKELIFFKHKEEFVVSVFDVISDTIKEKHHHSSKGDNNNHSHSSI